MGACQWEASSDRPRYGLGADRRDRLKLLFVLGRRWWSCADIAPRIRFLFRVRTALSRLDRRFVGAIKFPVVYPFFGVSHRTITADAIYMRRGLSGSNSYRQNCDYHDVDGHAQHR